MRDQAMLPKRILNSKCRTICAAWSSNLPVSWQPHWAEPPQASGQPESLERARRIGSYRLPPPGG